MRRSSKRNGISIRAISGTEVVILALNATKEAAQGLLGFQISRRQGRGSFRMLGGGKTFKGNAKRAPLIQGFMWSDYVVDPGESYTYRVVPVYGTATKPKPSSPVDVDVTTENPDDGTHAIYFNRGVAGSQAYSRRFGQHRRWYKVEHHGRTQVREFLKPADVPNHEAYKWLSRGLEEAMLGFIAKAKGKGFSIRAAVYEFTYLPAIQAFVDALERGVDVKIIHHAKQGNVYAGKYNKEADSTTAYDDGSTKTFKNREMVAEKSFDSVATDAFEAWSKVGLRNREHVDAFDQMLISRTDTQISHNKFIVLLKNNKPFEVWSGSTNFTDGGIFGQSNVGHVVRDPKIAKKYLDYWNKLSGDPKKKSKANDPPLTGIRNWTVAKRPDLSGKPPKGITPIFSPRLTASMLDWYADRMDAASNSVFFTAAFTVADQIFNRVVHEKSNPNHLRYLLLENKSGKMREKYNEMKRCKQNRIAWGDVLKPRPGQDDDVELETLTGLNENVQFLHTKFMLIDPLSDDPIVINGSANFSTASTISNDENMLIIRGDTREADIFLGEFMRMYNHFASRNRRNALSDARFRESLFLQPDDRWTRPYYREGNPLRSERVLFGVAAE